MSQRIRNYIATTAIGARRFAKFAAADGQVAIAAAATDAVIGITTDIDAAINDRCDVIHGGFAEVIAGAAFTRGALLVSDANGAAITAAPSAGSNVRFGAYALASAAAAGDIVPVFVDVGSLQG